MVLSTYLSPISKFTFLLPPIGKIYLGTDIRPVLIKISLDKIDCVMTCANRHSHHHPLVVLLSNTSCVASLISTIFLLLI